MLEAVPWQGGRHWDLWLAAMNFIPASGEAIFLVSFGLKMGK